MTEKRIKILVFPAGTEIAFEIHDALKNVKFIELYGATSVPCHANFVFKNCVEGVPFVDAPDLIEKLNKVIDRYGIDYVYPAHDSALLRLTEEQVELHAKVVTSPLETVRICRDKSKTYEYLAGAEYMPKVYGSADEVEDYPVFAKPAVGQGGQGAMPIVDRLSLERVLASGEPYVVCEYLPGEEYTVDCFTDRHGNLLYIGQRTRDRIRSGIAVRSHFVDTEVSIFLIAEELNDMLDFNGAWFFQVKEDVNGEYKLMEVAPRIAGTMGLSRNVGVNLPLLTMYNHLGEDVEILMNDNRITLDRAFISRFKSNVEYDKVYVDLDDTIVVKGNINPLLMAFLYQARNKGKKVVLLTRHRWYVQDTLQELNIAPGLFDAIVCIEGGSKADYVCGRAILIDDSFSERKSVKKGCGIPVFDVDMVESLIDWCA